MSSAPLRGSLLRWVPGRIPLALHAPGKAVEGLARTPQQLFPGSLERSEAQWKAIRDPAQELAAKRRRISPFAEVSRARGLGGGNAGAIDAQGRMPFEPGVAG